MFVACKTEEMKHITYGFINQRVVQKNLQPENLRNFEIILLNGIRFHINIYLPFKPSVSLLNNFSAFCNLPDNAVAGLDKGFTFTTIRSIEPRLYGVILLSDAVLNHPPAVIALGAALHYFRESCAQNPRLLEVFQKYLVAISEQDAQILPAVAETAALAALAQLDPTSGRLVHTLDMAQIKTANRKLNAYKAWETNQLAKMSLPPYIPTDPPVAQQPSLDASTSQMNAD